VNGKLNLTVTFIINIFLLSTYMQSKSRVLFTCKMLIYHSTTYMYNVHQRYRSFLIHVFREINKTISTPHIVVVGDPPPHPLYCGKGKGRGLIGTFSSGHFAAFYFQLSSSFARKSHVKVKYPRLDVKGTVRPD